MIGVSRLELIVIGIALVLLLIGVGLVVPGMIEMWR